MKTLRERLNELELQNSFVEALTGIKPKTGKRKRFADLMEDVDMHPPSHYEHVVPDKGSKEAVIKVNDDNESHISEIKPPADLSKHVGSMDYYKKRAEDYKARYPWKTTVPYYLDFGDKYLKAFMLARSDFSPKGQAWVDATALLLKKKMEEGLAKDRSKTDVRQYLEFDEQKLINFAFDTHVPAYKEAGACHLMPGDIYLIGSIIKTEFNEKTVLHALSLLAKCLTEEQIKLVTERMK